MRKSIIVLLLLTGLLSVLLAMTRATSAAPSPYKQIAAPPSDFALLRLPDPAAVGNRSHSAVLIVEPSAAADDFAWTGQLPSGGTTDATLTVLAPGGAAWGVELIAPDGATVDLRRDNPGIQRAPAAIGIDGANVSGDAYSFAQMAGGRWQVRVTAASAEPGLIIFAEKNSPLRLYSHLTTGALISGQPVGLAAYAYANDGSTQGAPTAVAGVVESARVRLTHPDGRVELLPMADDGRHADGAAGDGVYGARWAGLPAGTYTAQLVVTGRSADGSPFVRTSQHVMPIVDGGLDLTGRAESRVVDSNRLQINLGVAGDGVAAAQTVQVAAEVWGTGRDGWQPVAWIGGMTDVVTVAGRTVLPLSLDARWIALAGVQAPFELRNVRVQDRTYHVPLAQAERLAFSAESLPAAAFSSVTAVTDEMLMGTRPARSADAGAGAVADAGADAGVNAGVLMLVHGYCSEGVWPTSSFSTYYVFQDYNQNRSHDQFALNIRDQGAAYSSFGAVAHSQGGAASLHLYTYYWSGFDYSTGNRLIQSVGTPYQGTNLAGLLAVIGDFFGVGCGSNYDLTYSGAAYWLAGIPSWARSRVHYFTTQDKDVWWRWDYCVALGDPLLDDPEDGVVEKWSGQLSGGNNRGHKSGQCHTEGMRDPAQTQDGSRNADMNVNANR